MAVIGVWNWWTPGGSLLFWKEEVCGNPGGIPGLFGGVICLDLESSPGARAQNLLELSGNYTCFNLSS